MTDSSITDSLTVSCKFQRHESWANNGVTGMYGPPLRRKRNARMSEVGLRKCIRPLLEWITPGQDGMRCALLPISYSVLRDFFRLRV